jgi:hypothetical protein
MSCLVSPYVSPKNIKSSHAVASIRVGVTGVPRGCNGAGRKVSRSQCDEKFGRLSPEDLRRPKDKKSGIDNLVICENRDLLRQEHGKAYKDIDQVIKDLVQLGLAEVVAVFKPILTYKTRIDSLNRHFLLWWSCALSRAPFDLFVLRQVQRSIAPVVRSKFELSSLVRTR